MELDGRSCFATDGQSSRFESTRTAHLIGRGVRVDYQEMPTAWQRLTSGNGFTCTLTTPPYQSSSQSIAQQCNPPNDPNSGEFNPSGNGYIFTHDATKLIVHAKVIIDVSAQATWIINGTTYSEPVPLNGGQLVNQITLNATPETSTIQQVEGITQPPA